MGNVYTKTGEYEDEPVKTDLEVSIGDVDLDDPRSPTPDINRTPIQNLDNKARKITKNVDLSKECFEKCDKGAMMNPSIRALMSQIDPRSPTLDFQRTPLAVLLKNPELAAKYNALNSSTTLDCSQISNAEETPQALCQRNLDSALADLSIAPVESEDVEPNLECGSEIPLLLDSNIQSEVCVNRVPGLLETNLDYIETDLDTVKRKKKKTLKLISDSTTPIQNDHENLNSEGNSPDSEEMSLKSDEMSPKSEEMSPKSEETTPKSEETSPRSEEMTPKSEETSPRSEEMSPQLEDSESPVNKHILKIKDLSDKDPRSPSFGINRTPIVLVENRDDSSQRADIHAKMQEIFDNNMKLQQKRTDNKIQDPEFLLIYEDNLENKVSTPIKKPGKSEACRTPLACMMNTQGQSRNTPVKTHTLPKKSKIPVKVKPGDCFMDDKLNGNAQNFAKKGLLIDSIENTPPKAHHARWDQDKSVLL